MKFLITALLILSLSAPAAFAQARRDITVYDPLTAIHPFKLLAMVIRPPIGLLTILVKGGYYFLDSDPIRRGFNIEYESTIRIDEDY